MAIVIIILGKPRQQRSREDTPPAPMQISAVDKMSIIFFLSVIRETFDGVFNTIFFNFGMLAALLLSTISIRLLGQVLLVTDRTLGAMQRGSVNPGIIRIRGGTLGLRRRVKTSLRLEAKFESSKA